LKNKSEKVSVLFVCMGNICRSPTAQGIFEGLVEREGLSERIQIDSAGTHAYHVGEGPDERAQAAALSRGFDLSGQRARKVKKDDFDVFDYVLVMDHGNYGDMQINCPTSHRHKLRLFLEFAEDMPEDEVPDPYYGGAHGFEHVIDLVEAASLGLLADIRQQFKL